MCSSNTNKVKHILFMIDSLGEGGAEKVLINILRRMDTQRYKITVFLLYKQGTYIEQVPDYVKVKFFVLGNEMLKNRVFSKLLYKVYRKIVMNLNKILGGWIIYKFFIKEEFDTEVAFLEGDACLFVSNSKNLYSKKIAWIHTDLEKRITMDRLKEKRALEKMNQIICVSNGSEFSVIKLYPELAYKIKVIYNPIDSSEILDKAQEKIDFNFKSHKFTFISVGRLEAPKGYENLIKVHKALIDEGISHHLIILGEGRLRNKLERMICDLNITDSITLLGFIQNPYPYVKKSDAMVISSVYEGFPLAMAEGLILGKPIVSTNCVGPSEVLNNKYGILVEVGNLEELKENMKRMILDKNLREYFSNKALERSRIFDIDKTIMEIDKIL